MADWDFSEYDDAELATLSASVKAKLIDLTVGPKSGSLDGGAFSEMPLSELKSLQAAVNAEERARGANPDIDDDFIATEFEEASS